MGCIVFDTIIKTFFNAQQASMQQPNPTPECYSKADIPLFPGKTLIPVYSIVIDLAKVTTYAMAFNFA